MDKITNLTGKIEESLNTVQKVFEDYQNNFFSKRTPEFFCLELNGEAGELADAEKKRWKGREVDDDVFSDEAADVLIALMNYSNARGINLGKAVNYKLKIIESKRIELAKRGMDY